MRGIRIVSEVEPRLPLVRVDPEQIRQALWNLLINAKEAIGGQGEIRIEGRRKGEGAIEIRVADTGPGFLEEDIVKLFEPFYTTKEHGTGLGLTNVRNLIESNNGKISARNRTDVRGAEFTLRLPAATMEH